MGVNGEKLSTWKQLLILLVCFVVLGLLVTVVKIIMPLQPIEPLSGVPPTVILSVSATPTIESDFVSEDDVLSYQATTRKAKAEVLIAIVNSVKSFPVAIEDDPEELENLGFAQQPVYNGPWATSSVVSLSVLPKVSEGSISVNVFASAGFDPVLAQRLSENSTAYLKAQNQTGIWWVVYATLHVMEHSALSSNPVNGEGPLGITKQEQTASSFNPGQLSVDGLANALMAASQTIVLHAERAQSVTSIPMDLNTTSNWESIQAEFAFTWNGRSGAVVSPCDGRTYYGTAINSGYVATNWNGNGAMFVRRGSSGLEVCSGWVEMSRDGYMANFAKLLRVAQALTQ